MTTAPSTGSKPMEADSSSSGQAVDRPNTWLRYFIPIRPTTWRRRATTRTIPRPGCPPARWRRRRTRADFAGVERRLEQQRVLRERLGVPALLGDRELRDLE